VQRGRVQVCRELAAEVQPEGDQPWSVSPTHAVDRVEDLSADLVRVQRRRVLELENSGVAGAGLQAKLNLVWGRVAAERNGEQVRCRTPADRSRAEISLRDRAALAKVAGYRCVPPAQPDRIGTGIPDVLDRRVVGSAKDRAARLARLDLTTTKFVLRAVGAHGLPVSCW